MRLSDGHYKIIKEMESNGYVWLSNLSRNAIMRFRNKTRKGFNGFIKVDGLTFLTKRVADSISRGSKDSKPRLTLKAQNTLLVKDLITVEKELYELRSKLSKHTK